MKPVKVFEVLSRAGESGECILGSDDTGTHACYLIYGIMKPREKGRTLNPGKGHEEMFLAVKGSFSLSGDYEGIINEGQAIHLKGEDNCIIENMSDADAVYVMAGGHSDSGHH